MYNTACPKGTKEIPPDRKGSNIMKNKLMRILKEYFDYVEKYHIYDYRLK
jgi:hypothetical protein